MGIPPIQNPGIFDGQPTCPSGYYYDPASGLCQPIPGTPTVSAIKVTSWGLSPEQTDPVQAAKNWGVGFDQSAWWAAPVVALWMAFWGGVHFAVQGYFIGFDALMAFIADQVSASVTRSNPALWLAIGSMLSDLLGIDLDGGALYNQLATRGTLPAMQAVGGSLIDLLVGEFTGTATGTGGMVNTTVQTDPATGLPPATLTPLTGLNGAKALMGFVLTSAIRQANVDGLVDAIPFGLGAMFEKYSEGVRTNLGIGRMMRFALKPIFQDLVAAPLKWAINKEYTPTLLSPADAFSAYDQQIFDAPALAEELARHGYSTTRWGAIEWKGRSLPSREELRGLHLTGQLNDATYYLWMRRTGYIDSVTAMLDQWDDIKPARDAVLKAVGTAAGKYLSGIIASAQFQAEVNAMSTRIGGTPLLSPGEVAWLTNLPSLTGEGAKAKNLGIAGLMFDYENGIITLQEFQADATAMGYDSDQVSELTLRLLVKAKAAAEKAAAAKAKESASGTGTTSVPTPTPGTLGSTP